MNQRHIVHLLPAFVLSLLVCAFAGCSGTKNKAPDKTEAQSISSSVATNPAIVEVQRGKDSAFTMSLDIDPAQPRFGRKTRFTLSVTNDKGAPVAGAQARISLVMPLMDMGKNEFDLKPSGNGVYQGNGEFTMSGEWEVVTTAIAEGKKGKYTFNIRVAE